MFNGYNQHKIQNKEDNGGIPLDHLKNDNSINLYHMVLKICKTYSNSNVIRKAIKEMDFILSILQNETNIKNPNLIIEFNEKRKIYTKRSTI